jgi:hypothetical protein
MQLSLFRKEAKCQSSNRDRESTSGTKARLKIRFVLELPALVKLGFEVAEFEEALSYKVIVPGNSSLADKKSPRRK